MIGRSTPGMTYHRRVVTKVAQEVIVGDVVVAVVVAISIIPRRKLLR